VVAHGGAVRVDSAPGRGTTLHLSFPTSRQAPPLAPALQAGVRLGAPQGAGLHVLYVDDDEVIVLMVERLLTQAGYRMTAFKGSRAAVAAVRAEPRAFDLVVSDFSMPGLTGMDVARDVAAARADLPVVITSGYISDELQAPCCTSSTCWSS
jgi:CheY-like chemotaxis protein